MRCDARRRPLVGGVGLTEDADLEVRIVSRERKTTAPCLQECRSMSDGCLSSTEQSTCPQNRYVGLHGSLTPSTPYYLSTPTHCVGAIPPELGRLQALKKLDLTGNKLSGEVKVKQKHMSRGRTGIDRHISDLTPMPNLIER